MQNASDTNWDLKSYILINEMGHVTENNEPSVLQ
jgi:hypothetical protein